MSRLMEYRVFKEQIGASLVLAPIAPLVARGLTIMEFLLVVMLIVPRWRLKGLYAATVLMIAFTIYIIALMTFNDHCHAVVVEYWQLYPGGSILFSIARSLC